MLSTSIAFYFVSMSAYAIFSGLLLRALPAHWQLELHESAPERVTTLDGLRGILALSVLISHIEWNYVHQITGQWLEVPSNFYHQMGVMSVALFFFITGYLFWSRLVKHGNLNPLHYYRDRLARLGPAYWATFLGFLALVFIASRFHLEVSPELFLAQLLGWASFLGAGHDINAVHESYRWLGQVWTLRLEWSFYLALPFLVWFARRRLRVVALIAVAGVLFAVMSRVNVPGIFGHLWRLVVDYLHFLAGTFSVGMLTAVIRPGPYWIALARSRAATIISAMLLAITALWVPPQYGVFESAMLALPFFCLVHGNDWFGILRSVPMRFAGRISYSIYLMHSVVMQFFLLVAAHFFHPNLNGVLTFWLLGWCSGALSIVISAVAWQYLERPFLKGFPFSRSRNVRLASLEVAQSTSSKLSIT